MTKKPKTRAVKAWGLVDRQTGKLSGRTYRIKSLAKMIFKIEGLKEKFNIVRVEIRECRRGS